MCCPELLCCLFTFLFIKGTNLINKSMWKIIHLPSFGCWVPNSQCFNSEPLHMEFRSHLQMVKLIVMFVGKCALVQESQPLFSCMADLLLDWFGFNQTSKYVNNLA